MERHELSAKLGACEGGHTRAGPARAAAILCMKRIFHQLTI